MRKDCEELPWKEDDGTGPCGSGLFGAEPVLGGVVDAEGLDGGACACVGPMGGGGELISLPPIRISATNSNPLFFYIHLLRHIYKFLSAKY